MKSIAVILFLLVFAGCQSTPPTPVVIVPPTGKETAAQIEGFKSVIETMTVSLGIQREISRQLSETIYAIQNLNAHNPAGFARDGIAAHANKAASALPAPTPEQKAHADRQNADIMAGNLAKVQAELDVDIAANKAHQAQLAEAQKNETEALRKLADVSIAAEKERTEAASKLQKQFTEMTQRIKDAENQAKLAVQKEQVADLNRAAAICAALAAATLGLAVAFGGIAALKKVFPFVVLCIIGALMCYGLAQIVSQWWFKWAVLAGLGVILALSAWWVWRQSNQGTLRVEAEKKAAKFKAVLGDIVPVLDDAYESAEATGKEVLDRLVFDKLSGTPDKEGRMATENKAVIHEIRGEKVAKA